MHPYRDSHPSSDDRLARLMEIDAAHANIRSIRHLVISLCALASVGHFAPWPAVAQLLFAIWASAGVIALIAFAEERRLGRLRERELRELEL